MKYFTVTLTAYFLIIQKMIVTNLLLKQKKDNNIFLILVWLQKRQIGA